MKALAVLRATTGGGELGWMVALTAAGLLVATAQAAAVDAQAGAQRLVAINAPIAAMMLMFRYSFGSHRAALFWFDAARQQVPGIHAACLQAEALRLVGLLTAFVAGIVLGLAAFGAIDRLPILLPSLAVGLAAAGLGLLTAVMPYRWAPLMALLDMAAILGFGAGVLPSAGAGLVALGVGTFVAALLVVAWRLRGLLARGVDPAVGGDYAFVFSFGRHSGDVFSAPNSAPLAVLMRERQARAGEPALPDDPDARVRGLLSEPAWQATVSPRRHRRQWALLILGYPALMLPFFALWSGFLSDDGNFGGLLPFMLLMLVLVWGLAMATTMQEQYARTLRDTGAAGDVLRDELRLLPGVVTGRQRWDRRLRPLWAPAGLTLGAIAMGLGAVLGVQAPGLAALAGLLGCWIGQMRLSMHVGLQDDPGAIRWVTVAGLVNGLVLFAVLPLVLQGLVAEIDAALARGLAQLGTTAQGLAAITLLPALALQVGVAWRLRRPHPGALWRPAAG